MGGGGSRALRHQPAVVPFAAPGPSPRDHPQEGREFKATCLVDEEEMKKLLQERGHVLENHVERLWAYLTIQELLAKRYDPCGGGGRQGLWNSEVNGEGVLLGLRGWERVRLTGVGLRSLSSYRPVDSVGGTRFASAELPGRERLPFTEGAAASRHAWAILTGCRGISSLFPFRRGASGGSEKLDRSPESPRC